MMRVARRWASTTRAIDAPPNAIFPLGDQIGFVALVDQMKQPAGPKVVNAARISYNREKDVMDDSDRKLASFLWAHGHTSPFRHTFYTFHWKAPLFVFRQAFKYQVGSTWRKYETDGGHSISANAYDVLIDTDKGCSWNEVSGRYVKLKDEFYVPMKMRGNPPHGNKQASITLPADFDHEGERDRMLDEFQLAYRLYQSRLNRGVAKEIARTGLPQSIYTQAYWTVSLQGVIHFLSQRLHVDSQFEIRCYAEAIYESLAPQLTDLGISKDLLQQKH